MGGLGEAHRHFGGPQGRILAIKGIPHSGKHSLDMHAFCNSPEPTGSVTGIKDALWHISMHT